MLRNSPRSWLLGACCLALGGCDDFDDLLELIVDGQPNHTVDLFVSNNSDEVIVLRFQNSGGTNFSNSNQTIRPQIPRSAMLYHATVDAGNSSTMWVWTSLGAWPIAIDDGTAVSVVVDASGHVLAAGSG